MWLQRTAKPGLVAETCAASSEALRASHTLTDRCSTASGTPCVTAAPTTRARGGRRTGASGLAMRRLAIIDLSPGGHQPMADASGRFWLVFNGEIYNYRALRAELESRGHRFRSASDSEVLLESLPSLGSRLPEPPQRDVRLRPLRPRGAGADPGPRPCRREAALLPARGPEARVRLGAEGADGGSRVPAGTRSHRPSALPRLRLRPRRVVHPARREEAPPRPRAPVSARHGRARSLAILAAARARDCRRRTSGGACRRSWIPSSSTRCGCASSPTCPWVSC